MIARGQPLPDILDAIARNIERTTNDMLCTILLLDPDGVHVRHGAAPSMDESFIRAIDGQPIGPNAGSCGTAAYRKEAVFVSDIASDPLWADYRELAQAHGLRACWSTPIMSRQGLVLGTFAMYYREARAPGERDIRLIERVAQLAGIAIERKRDEEQIHLQRNRLEDLSRRLIEAHETAQRAVGRELHDQIGQMLTALKLTLEVAPQLPPELAEKKMAGAQEMLDELMNRVSALSLELRPPMLDDFGLIPALLWHVNRYQEQTGIAVDFKHSGLEGRRFPIEIETTAYRITQEALTNAARHAGAGRIWLEVCERDGWLSIEIEDDGAGFKPQAAFSKHRGLAGMRERAELAGGGLHVQSQPGKGTQISIRLPLEETKS
jgi:signal transduction histidine kinase